MDKPGDRDSRNAPRAGALAPPLQAVIAMRWSRRRVLATGVAATVAGVGLAGCRPDEPAARPTAPAPAPTPVPTPASRFDFPELPRGTGPGHAVAPGYRVEVLVRWGDPLFPDSPPYDPRQLTAAAQARQFGYNNDFIGFVPLPAGPDGAARGLLCVNHEYASSHLMFADFSWLTDGWISAATCAVEQAALGGSVVEVVERYGRWQVVIDSPYNRRILGHGTPIALSGPAAGHARLRTGGDPTGTRVDGMFGNCAGGITPWQTWLSAEENFDMAFSGELADGHPEARNHQTYGVPGDDYAWGRFDPAFDLAREPCAPNRYGWAVEIDPLDPASMPKKRTALGRLKHEGATTVVARDGRVVVYMGDDERFEHVYKFVSRDAYRADARAANLDLLDHGTLHAARFDADGTVHWLPLVHGEGPLVAANGFADPGDVLIEARRAADMVGATPMDRPEDIEASPVTGKVYLVLTNNDQRRADQVDAANPRAVNTAGHIIEIGEDGDDPAALRGRWAMLVRCGDPADPGEGAQWNAATSVDGWFGSPDNVAFDRQGRMWVATDGNDGSDGLWGLETDGPLRGTGRAFFRAPDGAEVCGPCFSPDGGTLFLAVQHPGDGTLATFADPATRWPDFIDGAPPRPAVVVVRRDG